MAAPRLTPGPLPHNNLPKARNIITQRLPLEDLAQLYSLLNFVRTR